MDADDRETEHQESRATAGRYGNTSAKCANHTQTASSPFILGSLSRESKMKISEYSSSSASTSIFFAENFWTRATDFAE